MRGWVPSLLALSGCNGVLGLVQVSTPGPDADLDAAADASVIPTPIAYFNFNGNRKDKISDVAATCMPNCPADAPGIHDGAVAFNGGSDCLQFPPSGAFPALPQFTVAVWFFDKTDTSYSIVAVPYAAGSTSEDSWQIDTDTSTTLRFSTDLNGSAQTAQLSSAFTLNNWHHAATTFDGRQLSLYVDGVAKVRYMASTSGISYDTVPVLYIGCDRDTGSFSRFFAGSLDDLYVFDSVLTQTQITYLATP